jgi:hypothetical protein
MDLAEAKKLIGRALGLTFRCQRAQIYNVEEGSEVGVGRFDEGIWRKLTAEYNIAMSGQQPARKRRRFQSFWTSTLGTTNT